MRRYLHADTRTNSQRSRFFLSGVGEVVVEGESRSVAAGDAVFIPGNIEHMSVNTGSEPLRLLYVLAADSFEEVIYKFQ